MTSPPDDDVGDPTARDPAPGMPHPFYNWMSMIGSAIAASSLTAAIFLAVLGYFTGDASGYAGLLLLVPISTAGFGLLLMLAGYLRERWRQKRGLRSSFFERTVVDPFHWVRSRGLAAILVGLVGATFLLLGAGAGSLAVVEYSESNEFCGETCHEVMAPEYTAYQESLHAQIDCVECHVGSGGESFLRAKLGGVCQLVRLATDNVTRPIPTPIHGRRLSDEMCSTCHNRERFIGYKAVTRTYFSGGEDTDSTRLGMLMKVGGGDGGLMPGGGIHYHMLLAKKVEYIARDPKRQQIAWVRVVREDGEVKEYNDDDAPLTDEERASLPVHRMECIDCHSRPAHEFAAPVDSVNQALATGAISPEVPYIKQAAVRALDGGYETTDEAMAGIEENLESFYEDEDEDVLEDHADELEAAVAELRRIYRRSIFPEMKASWRAHPDNLGHRDSPGCFRCHNDVMLDDDGEALFHDCVTCHAVLAQDDEAIQTVADLEVGREFVHPEDGEPFEEFTLCTDCHTGGSDVYE